jgi:hypothetical protein
METHPFSGNYIVNALNFYLWVSWGSSTPPHLQAHCILVRGGAAKGMGAHRGRVPRAGVL